MAVLVYRDTTCFSKAWEIVIFAFPNRPVKDWETF